MKLLDLFCGAGGCARGYTEAGFEVHGVDNRIQPRYLLSGAVAFYQADALEFLAEHGHEYDAIHASPPCQAYSVCVPTDPYKREHPDLLGPTRDLLRSVGRPYVIENVPRSPMRADFVLNGRMFDLRVQRERWFETSGWGFDFSPPVQWEGEIITVVGHGTPGWSKAKLGRNPTVAEKRAAMGIDWMDRGTLSQAIPPAYTRWIGERLMAHLKEEEAA